MSLVKPATTLVFYSFSGNSLVYLIVFFRQISLSFSYSCSRVSKSILLWWSLHERCEYTRHKNCDTKDSSLRINFVLEPRAQCFPGSLSLLLCRVGRREPWERTLLRRFFTAIMDFETYPFAPWHFARKKPFEAICSQAINFLVTIKPKEPIFPTKFTSSAVCCLLFLKLNCGFWISRMHRGQNFKMVHFLPSWFLALLLPCHFSFWEFTRIHFCLKRFWELNLINYLISTANFPGAPYVDNAKRQNNI